jgi:hypothetical protein
LSEPITISDPRQAAIERAVRGVDARDPRIVAAINAIADDEASGRTRAVVVSRGYQRLLPIIEGDESPAERSRRENAAAMIAMEAGSSPMQVARRLSTNPNARHRYAQRFRELLRKKNAGSAF